MVSDTIEFEKNNGHNYTNYFIQLGNKLQFVKANGKAGQQQNEVDYRICWYFGDKLGIHCGTSWFCISSWYATEWYSCRCNVYNVCSGYGQPVGQYKGLNCIFFFFENVI